MEKFKQFISYCSNELMLLGYSLVFSICFIFYGNLFDFYNISAFHRALIIILVSLGTSSLSAMMFIFKRIFKK